MTTIHLKTNNIHVVVDHISYLSVSAAYMDNGHMLTLTPEEHAQVSEALGLTQQKPKAKPALKKANPSGKTPERYGLQDD